MRSILVCLLATCAGAVGAVLDNSLVPVADTCLIETAPDNNMGGATYFNAGSNMHGSRNRGLIQFDVSQIPSGSIITSAVISVSVVGTPTDGPTASVFEFHRMLRSWGEGSELPLDGAGRGAAATTNEATWNDRFAFANAPWLNPGGEPDVDFSSDITTATTISDENYYSFPESQTATDVQFWLDNPGQNFGWMMKTEDESVTSSARRFGTREDPSNTPLLDVSFIPATHIDAPTISSNQMTFSFVAFAQQNYVVEYQSAINGNWTVLTNIAPQQVMTNITVVDTLSDAQRFYRVTAN